MTAFNLNTLLHRTQQWEQMLPDGTIHRGTTTQAIPVRIPKIQRDYAEGRLSESIERKRRSLLNDILDVLYGNKANLSFDFVYGYKNTQQTGDLFEPLDGQQRLTTLFLLSWLFGREADLRENGHSLLVYETRDSSEEFCHWLVNQCAKDLIDSWLNEINSIKQQNTVNRGKWQTDADRLQFPLQSVPSLAEYMQKIDTFKWDWYNDPNIHSMITVLETAIQMLQERGLTYQDGIQNNANLDNITFMLLDNLDCDGDQLFVKMNARGKALTDFEILKSSLEEEIERQKIGSPLVDNWRTAIDRDWIDYCWDSSNFGSNPTIEDIRKVEEKLEEMLLRLIGKSFFKENIIIPTNIPTGNKNYATLFNNSISKNVDEVFNCYVEYVQHERAIGSTSYSTMNFQEIYDDMQNLLYKDSVGLWKDASALLPNKMKSLLNDFWESPKHNNRVMIYAMLAYLRIVPAKQIASNSVECSNFVDWMRFICNVYNLNNQNTRLDNFTDVQKTIIAVDQWLAEYNANYHTNQSQDILRLISQYIVNNSYSQEKARLEEEAIKANLRLNGSANASAATWEKSILTAEDNRYLCGQIIAPLSWSKNGSMYDISLFNKYTDALKTIFDTDYDGNEIDALIIQTMLCYADYRHNLKNDLGSLGRLNNDRDYSWKQYLRKEDTTGYYGSLFKQLIDSWLQSNNVTLSLADLLKQEIADNKGKFNINDWQYYLVNISTPQRLLDMFNHIGTNGRYVYTEPSGHPFIFRSDTFRTTNRYELLTTYLAFENRLWSNNVKLKHLAHTAETDGAYIELEMTNNDIIRVSLSNGNLYNIYKNMTQLHADITINQLEQELINLGVITSL